MVGTTGATPVSTAVMECLLPVLATDADRPMTAGARQPSELPIRFRSPWPPAPLDSSTTAALPKPPRAVSARTAKTRTAQEKSGMGRRGSAEPRLASARGRARPGIGALARPDAPGRRNPCSTTQHASRLGPPRSQELVRVDVCLCPTVARDNPHAQRPRAARAERADRWPVGRWVAPANGRLVAVLGRATRRSPAGEVEDSPSGAGTRPEAQPGTARGTVGAVGLR